jgi:hypothetical protein
MKPSGHSIHAKVKGKPWLRVVISILACLHLLAVFAEPFRFFTQSGVKPASEEAGRLRSTLAPYVEFMYLSHGYAFFAPNPGPSHLLECELKSEPTRNHEAKLPSLDSIHHYPASSSKQHTWLNAPDRARVNLPAIAEDSAWRIFPDRHIDRPRLLYHRYFMLSEFYQTLFAPVRLTEDELNEPGVRERWEQDRKLYSALQDSIVNRLKSAYSVDEVELSRIEHALPSPMHVLNEGWKLEDPRLYTKLLESLDQP